MGRSVSLNTRMIRKNFTRIQKIIDIPDLIDIQKRSYERFLQKDIDPDKREDIGLQEVFKSVFPIRDFNGTSSLDFVSYDMGEPKYGVDECRQRGMTYALPLKVTVRLVVWDVDDETVTRNIRDVKEQEVYFGEIPLMTDNGTFVINGTERVIVSQLHRSPGIFFDHDKGKTHISGKLLYSARIIPQRGSWIDLEFDPKDIIYVRIDRRRKFPATILIKALGYSTEDLLNYYYKSERIILEGNMIYRSMEPDLLVGVKTSNDIISPETGEIIIKKGRKITQTVVRKLIDAGIKHISAGVEDILGCISSHDVIDPNLEEVVLKCNDELTLEKFKEIKSRGIKEFDLLHISDGSIDLSLRNTLAIDKISSAEDAIIEIYRRLRPSDPPTVETATIFFSNLFFNPERYDLSEVGRLKLNYKLGLNIPLKHRTLKREDILEAVRVLVELKNGKGSIDDIDNLGNRRVKSVGELVENQYRLGLVRMERAIKERMSLQEIETLMPHDLINAKPVLAVVKEFFGSSQLSQFMDQTNPLSEVTHKRRLSALGPGGLTRERAGFEVRDVHPTHYGRICPIETPEGPNIGLIVSLSTFARVNEYGFIETPYREVANGVATKNIKYLSAIDEDDHIIAQANALLDENGRFVMEVISARKSGEFIMISPEEVDFMDVSPNQLVSVAASLIPFLENDDANRALMGSNMQRQAVPLMRTDAPLIGTGIESVIARDSGVTVIAKKNGVVENVDSSRIVVRIKEEGKGKEKELESSIDIYNLVKYQRSNQNTCINQKPLVNVGDEIKKGEIIADGTATYMGELALGHNVLVAFMPWGGYNFEDSILISEKVLKDDSFTSIHIEEFEVVARDTKLGKEEITRDIPNLGEESLKDIDESGIIRIGAEVGPGDILVGKITPKGETQLSPEEKLLRAIFGEKARDVQDTSLRVPPGVQGTIINAKVFSRRGVEKDERTKYIENSEVSRLLTDQEDEISILKDCAVQKIKKLLIGKTSATKLTVDKEGTVLLKKRQVITEGDILNIPVAKWRDVSIVDGKDIESELDRIIEVFHEQVDLVKLVFEQKISRITKGDELPPGVIKMVKVNVAAKRKLSVGDKMAGRHGNKGVLSRVLPEEDMPYLEDGTPVDIVLNPLGVPSRMNVGQILETHLGWAAKGLGNCINEYLEKNYSVDAIKSKIKEIYSSKEFDQIIDDASDEEIIELAKKLRNGVYMASPVFDGASEDEVKKSLALAGLPVSGKTILFDGRTGEAFDQKVTVGMIYMMKLHHLVDDKIHARSIGPYSLVTQQPLGGKAQFGGQRLGEMEVWALEAYGAAYCLQEFLTVKSDDVWGRTKTYETIVKGGNVLESGLPESFNVLVKELQSLALDVELIEEQGVYKDSQSAEEGKIYIPKTSKMQEG
ncbi:MAG: DNA-directed RNA polymerase subunit beta [Desulfobacteria bacterium]